MECHTTFQNQIFRDHSLTWENADNVIIRGKSRHYSRNMVHRYNVKMEQNYKQSLSLGDFYLLLYKLLYIQNFKPQNKSKMLVSKCIFITTPMRSQTAEAALSRKNLLYAPLLSVSGLIKRLQHRALRRAFLLQLLKLVIIRLTQTSKCTLLPPLHH